jgi:hydrogenase-4 component F
MILHTLIKSALFQALIRGAALRGGGGPGNYGFSHLRGIIATNKYLGWALGACVFALVGLPPSGLFVTEFLIVSQTIQRAPLLSLPLGLGLLLCAVAIIRNIGPLVFDPPPAGTAAIPAGRGVGLVVLHLAAVLLLAFAMPPALVLVLSGISAGLQ